VQALCYPCIKRQGDHGRFRIPSSGERVCGRVSGGVNWDAARKGIGVYHRPKTGDCLILRRSLAITPVLVPKSSRIYCFHEHVVIYGPSSLAHLAVKRPLWISTPCFSMRGWWSEGRTHPSTSVVVLGSLLSCTLLRFNLSTFSLSFPGKLSLR
jgi:hypothetical protein